MNSAYRRVAIAALVLTAVAPLHPKAQAQNAGQQLAGRVSSPDAAALHSTPIQFRVRGRGFFNFLFGGPSREEEDPYYRDGQSQGYDGYGFPQASYGTYRTLCVRLCDGYYWPISFSVTRGHFALDSNQCQSSCKSPARLYVYPNPGGELEQMTDLDGVPYASLPSAFRYRTEYVADCGCKPDPWSDEAKAEYARRAVEETAMAAEQSQPAVPEPTIADAAPPAPATARTHYWSVPPRPPRVYDTERRGGWRFPFFGWR